MRVSVGADGAFEGYASLFDIRDTCGDVVAPGAFASSLRRRGAANVKMLWQHRPEEPIGVWASIEEDARGLKVNGRLDRAVARAREALSLIRAGALDGLSIGFRTLRATEERQGGRRLIEVDLVEISIVTFPALPQARIGAPTPSQVADDFGRKLAQLRMREAALGFEAALLRVR
ncbi:primosome assembly protein PriA [Methylosinus sp. 3S-1]|nr:primosome assembly protein PriA [Methylosinus sp. 3S-1]